MELLIGAGTNHNKRVHPPEDPDWHELVTLDINPDLKPDVVHDLTKLPLPFPDNHFDELHAYEVLEHTGQQGDWRFFFDQWSEFWRILKPCGIFAGTGPTRQSVWAWGDPGHTRQISRESLIFLCQPEYRQVGTTPMTDYRFCYKADFDPIQINDTGHTFVYILQAIKPPR